MQRPYLVVLSIAALVAALFLVRPSSRASEQLVSGRNGSVLFLVDAHNGLSNVHLATGFALLVNHPSVDVHFASFDKLAPELARLSRFARTRNPQAKEFHWHRLNGSDAGTTILASPGFNRSLLHQPPGLAGLEPLLEHLTLLMCPWEADELWNLYQKIKKLILGLDPALVVLDPIFRPAVDAARDLARKRVTISPNALTDIATDVQPWGSMFWKYPAVASGHPFPVPWRLIPANVWIVLRLVKQIMTDKHLRRKRAYLREMGVRNPIYLQDAWEGQLPWITQSFVEAGPPLIVPAHMKPCGPIVLDVAPAAEQDPELAGWVKRAPTMLVNLGSLLRYDEQMARDMARSFLPLLEASDVQILWKFRKSEAYGDSFLEPVDQYVRSGRLRLENWLNVDPLSLLATGDIIVSVHHGGANCFYETLLAGVPQVILPLWVDLYNFAQISEYLGVGVWPNKKSAPVFDPRALSQGYLRTLTGDSAAAMRRKARELSEVAAQYGGRDAAAAIVAEMAFSGHM
ncbi:hypothetical protein HIM_02336 [Hirsutella minnesotensis 3608]|nr:hypothetical protein HIM_02336 [Hirsutella minnesotensis 3608]